MPDDVHVWMRCSRCGATWEFWLVECRNFFTGRVTKELCDRYQITCPACRFHGSAWDFMTHLFPKAFISHHRHDKDVAVRIGEDLLKEGVDVWLDAWEVYPGDSIVGGIDRGLKECSHFVILLSRHSEGSAWLRDEVRAAIHRRITTGQPVILPVVLERCQVPELLRDIKRIEYQEGHGKAIDALLLGIQRPIVKPLPEIPGM